MSYLKKDFNYENQNENQCNSCTPDSQLVYLTETFYISSKKNSAITVKLDDNGLTLRKEYSGTCREQVIALSDVIGCRCLRSQKKKRGRTAACACSSVQNDNQVRVFDENPVDDTDSSAYLYIYAYVLKKYLRSSYKRVRTVLTLRFRSFDRFDENNREAQKWRCFIKQLMVGECPSKQISNLEERRILVILNPKSGSGKSREFFQQEVSPVFVEAEIPYDIQVTKRPNYAREYVRNKDIYQWKGIVVIGGDGIFYEVVNGIMEREDWKKVLQAIPIGIIPSGSGNGLAKTISHIYNEPYEPKPILNAALTAVRSKTALMDLVRVETRSEIMYSFLSVGWGLISDIDIESERIRSIGYQRFTIWSLHRLISLRKYNGKVSYLPATIVDDNCIPKINILKHSKSYNSTLDRDNNSIPEDYDASDPEFGDVLSLETSGRDDTSFRPRFDSWYSATSRKSAYYSVADSIYQSIKDTTSIGSMPYDTNVRQVYGPSPTIPSLMSPVPDEWLSEEGDFIMVQAAYQSHLGIDCYFAPSSKLNDGIIWLVIIRGGVPRSQILNFLLGMSSGTHIPKESHEFIKIVPVTAFRIEPSGTEGIMTVDGERVEYGPIQGEIFPGLANVMVPK